MKINKKLHFYLKADDNNQLNEKNLISKNLNYKRNFKNNSLFQSYQNYASNNKNYYTISNQKSFTNHNKNYLINNSYKNSNNESYFKLYNNTQTKSTNITNNSNFNYTNYKSNYKLDNNNIQYLYDKKFDTIIKEFFPYDFKHKLDTKKNSINKVIERNQINIANNKSFDKLCKTIKKRYLSTNKKKKIIPLLNLNEDNQENNNENYFTKKEVKSFELTDDNLFLSNKIRKSFLKKQTMKIPIDNFKNKLGFEPIKIKSKKTLKNLKTKEVKENNSGLIKANKLLKAISNMYESEYESLNKKNGDLISLGNLSRIVQLKKIQKNYLNSQDNVELDKNEFNDEGRRLKKLIEKLGGPRFFKYDFKIKTINEYNDWIGRGFGISRNVEKFEKGRNPDIYLKGIHMFKKKNNII